MKKDFIIFILVSAFVIACGKGYMIYLNSTKQQSCINRLNSEIKSDSILLDIYSQYKLNTEHVLDIIDTKHNTNKELKNDITYKEYNVSKNQIDSIISYNNE